MSCCTYDIGPHPISFTGANTWDGKTDPLEQHLQNEQITTKDKKTGKIVTGPLMKVIADSTKLECFDATSPKVLTFPIVMVDGDGTKHGFPEKVPDLQKHLDDPQNPMSQQEKDKKKRELESWRKLAMGKLSESRVYDAVVAAAKKQGEECLVMASYSTDKFMGVIKEKGKNVRNGNVLSPLNRHEKSVIDALKMDVDPTSDVQGLLGTKNDIRKKDIENEAHFNNLIYKKELKEMINRVKKPLLDSTDLSNLIQYCKYTLQLQDAANEVDIICSFPRRKKILQIDTKSSTEDKNILSEGQTAAKQTKKLNRLFSQWHGEILHGHTFYRAAAFPNVDTAAKFVAKPPSKSKPPCAKCQEYILTWDKIVDIEKWMTTHIFTGPVSVENYPAEYKLLVTRIIGFISLAPLNNFYFHTEAEAVNIMAKAITGEDSAIHGSASDAGATAALTELQANCGYQGIQDKDHALGSLQVFITWNQQQLSNILRINNMSWSRFMVLVSDYGTGKTLLLKNLARAEAERIMSATGSSRVFYISLGAAKFTNYDDAWNHDSIFDLSTRVEFQELFKATGINVEFRSTSDILNEMVPDPSKRTAALTVNQILVMFFLKYGMDHHYGDEVPTQDIRGGNFMFPTLIEAQDDVWRVAQGNIRLAMRPADSTGGGSTYNYNQELQNYRTTLETNYSVQFPSLDTRLRNSAQVAKLSDEVTGLTPGVTGSLPPYINTVTGITPKLILTKTPAERFTTGVEYAINIIDNQPVVILTGDSDKVDVIYQHLRSSPSPPPVTVYNPGPGGYYTDIQDKVRKYLQAPAGVLLTTVRLFNGMEATSVVVTRTTGAAERCAAMRATAHLVYIDYSASVKPGVKELCDVHDVTTSQPVITVQPTPTVQPVTPVAVQPVTTAQPVTTVQPTTVSVQPVTTAQPVITVQPTPTVQPVTPVSVQPVTTAQPVTTVQRVKDCCCICC